MLMTKLLRSLESWQSNQPQYSLSGQRFSCVNLAFRFSRSVFIDKEKKKKGREGLLAALRNSLNSAEHIIICKQGINQNYKMKMQ